MNLTNNNFYKEIKELLYSAKNKVYQTINTTMTQTYFQIGKRIVEEEQGGETRAEYGKSLLKLLSVQLNNEFGKGFSVDNLENMRRFYIAFQKSETVSRKFELSWSHYIFLTRIENINERNFYEIESIENSWSLRELKRQFDTGLFERLSLSGDKQKVKELSLNGQVVQTVQDLIKDPYILEFVGLPELSVYSESELEQKLIDKLEHFLLELGKGFTFVARQKHFDLDGEHFYIDLVFYNYKLKCFVLIDLKKGKLTHQDVGQMDMYVRIFEDKVKASDDNPTIGLILCSEKNEAVAKYSVLAENKQLFASKYKLLLPTEEQLERELLKEINLLED